MNFRMRSRMSRKMIIFQKSKHIKASTKNDHFSPNFTSYFLDPFSSSATQHWFRSHTHIATFNTLTMAPKTKKGANLKDDTGTKHKRARKPSSKVAESAATLDSSDEDVATSHPVKARRMMRISWTTARTERLLDWLEENPVDRQKLFSDSTKDAKDEGRRKRVAKGTKGEFHKLIAIYVFSVDADKEVRDDFAANSGNYSKSVDNYLGRYVFFYTFQPHAHQLPPGCERIIDYSMRSWGKRVLVLNLKMSRRGVPYQILLVRFLLLPLPMLTVVLSRTTRTRIPVLEASPWLLANTPQLQPIYSFVGAWTGSCC